MSAIDFKLMNVLLHVDDHAKDDPALYYRGEPEAITSGEAGASALCVTFRVDFLTYVNGLSARKWRKYAGLDTAWLHIELSGKGVLEVLGVADGADEPRVLETRDIDCGAPTGFDIEVDLTGEDLVGFALQADEASRLEVVCAHYFARVDEAQVNDIRLALSTTTFNNERFILPNIDLVKGAVAAEGEPVASRFHMFVVDNGRTLDAAALTDDIVTVIPNPNVGGAGGFARGMMAATEEEGAFTHVLLMDDDVRILPESILRTFNLLSLARGRYKDAFLNGAMLSLEDPARQFEDVARVISSGKYVKIKDDYRVDELADVIANERADVEVEQAYGAWWYSCIPVSAIRENGLPLPLFVRCDDVEFGIRNNPVYMTMNGICVWHASFEGRWRASVDCYQFTRNFHVLTAVHDCASERLAVTRLKRNVRQNLRDMDYGAAEMLLQGFEDYLAGPEFLMHADGAALMKEHAAFNEKLTPVGEMDPKLLTRAGVTEDVLSRVDLIVRVPTWLKIWRSAPYDKHYLPDFLLRDEPSYLVKYGPGTIEGSSVARKTVVCLEPTRKSASVRTMDKERFRAIRARERALLARWRKEGGAVRAAYREAMPTLTSRSFWEGYLKEMSERA